MTMVLRNAAKTVETIPATTTVVLHCDPPKDLDCSGANLSYTDLSYTNLTGAKMQRTRLTGANLQGANLTNATLISVNLRGANLSGVTMPDGSIWP